MHGTTPGFSSGADSRLAELERQRPEYRTWLRLLRETRRAVEDAAWRGPFTQPGNDGVGAVRAPGEPLLNRRELSVDPVALRGLVGRLVEAATTAGPGGVTPPKHRPSADTAMHLLLAALQHDLDGIAALAALAGVDPGTFRTVAVLAAAPLLRSARVPVAGAGAAGVVPRLLPGLRVLAAARRTPQPRPHPASALWRLRRREPAALTIEL